MNPELDKQLCDKYPKIFTNRYKSPQETCMCWGLEVGDGWYNLVDVLCEALTYTFTTGIFIDEEDGKQLGIKPHIDKEGKATYLFVVKSPQVVADQVKEKFGTLRFYCHLVYDKDNISLVETKKYPELDLINRRFADYIDGIVHFADVASGKTCEVTGTEGSLKVRGGWWKTLSNDIIKTAPYIDYKPLELKKRYEN